MPDGRERGGSSFSVDVVPETLRRTNLGRLTAGSPVTWSGPSPPGGRLDGHVVQGHVDATGRIEAISCDERGEPPSQSSPSVGRGEVGALMITIAAGHSIMRYVVEKGFVAVDGVSLTVVGCDDRGFSVTIIPHTREHTIMGARKAGDEVNLEVDILASTSSAWFPQG